MARACDFFWLNESRSDKERSVAIEPRGNAITNLEKCCPIALTVPRNAIERMFCRLKDCRRLATRYDKLAANFLGKIHLAAAIMWWL